MSSNYLTASTSGIATAGGNDGSLYIQTGPAGSPVNAITINSSGQATLLNTPLITTPNASLLNVGVALTTTSGTAQGFTGIPAWVNRITMSLSQVGTSSTSLKQIQIGSGSYATTGYLGASSTMSSAVASVTSTTGFPIDSPYAADRLNGSVVLTRVTGNNWVASGVLVANAGTNQTITCGGQITLGGVLDRIQLTTVNGTDTFAAGSLNIFWE